MIGGFKDKRLELYWLEDVSRGLPPDILAALSVKLHLVAYAKTLEDLRMPPANHLERLKGDLAGMHSIRVNRQWRLVFRWSGGEAFDLRLADYHR